MTINEVTTPCSRSTFSSSSKNWSQISTYRLQPQCFRIRSVLSASASSPCRCGNGSCLLRIAAPRVRAHRRFVESVPFADAVVASLFAAQLLCDRIWRHVAQGTVHALSADACTSRKKWPKVCKNALKL